MLKTYKEEDAVVLMSGGQDSTTSLFWALENFHKVYTVSILYHQKHSKEVEIARRICEKLNIENKVIDLPFLKDLVLSNLFKDTADVNQSHVLNKDIPSSYVPYRNLIFLTMASAWATTIGAKHIVIGVSETDYSGYADCRDVFIKSAQATLNLATDFHNRSNITIHTPLMWLNKADEFKLAEDLECLDVILNETLTCYNGVETMNAFGMGCNECPACAIRKHGYEEFLNKYKAGR